MRGEIVHHRPHEGVSDDLFLLHHHGKSLFLKAPGVQDLITAARFCRQRNEQIRFSECRDLADRIRACAGDDKIGHREKISHLFLDVFVLDVAGSSDQSFIELAFSAEMNDVVADKKLGERFPDSRVDGHGPERAAGHHDHGLFSGKSGKCKSLFPAAVHKLRPDGRSGHDRFPLRKVLQSLREVAADHFRHRETDLVGKTGGHVRFMRNDRDMQMICSADDRYCDKSAF